MLSWDELCQKIGETPLYQKFKPTTYTVNWGSRPRGQGKRSGGMIRGAMSDCPTGEKEYINYFGNIPEAQTNPEDFRLMDVFTTVHYLKAREFGLNHNQAMVFAIVQSGYINIPKDQIMDRIYFYGEIGTASPAPQG